MRKRGFTLIELLAVIVILAIVALIATPIIIEIQENATKESEKRSIELYASAIKNAISRYQLSNNGSISGVFTTEDGKTLTNGQSELTVEYNGNVKCTTTEIFEDGTVFLANCIVNGNEVDYTYGVSKIPTPEPQPTPGTFAEDSWETIAANVKAGNLNKYKVGDTKEVAITGYINGECDSIGLYTVRIANTSTPEECNQEGFSQSACGFVIEFVDIITTPSMNSSRTNKGGWPASSMRTYVNDTIYNALPQELKANIINTKVVSSHGSTDSANFTSTDKLYLLSTKEVWGKSIYYDTVEAETRQLDYYKNIGVTTSRYSGAIKNYNGTAYYWWLRPAYSIYDFLNVEKEGDWSCDTAHVGYGVAPAFRIG